MAYGKPTCHQSTVHRFTLVTREALSMDHNRLAYRGRLWDTGRGWGGSDQRQALMALHETIWPGGVRARVQSSDLHMLRLPLFWAVQRYCIPWDHLLKPLCPHLLKRKIKAQKSFAQEPMELIKSCLILKHLIPNPKHLLLPLLSLLSSSSPLASSHLTFPPCQQQQHFEAARIFLETKF